MADNTQLNLGASGDLISTDDIGGGVKVQRTKNTWGLDGTSTDVSYTDPMPVFGLGKIVTLSTDITRPTNATQYAVADAIADTTPTAGGFTFTGAARISGGSGIILDACFMSSAIPGTKLSAELLLYNQAVTAIADNAAFLISDAEVKTQIGIIPFSFINMGNNQYAQVIGVNMGFTCVGSANLRFLMRARNAYTPTSGEVITAMLKILQVD